MNSSKEFRGEDNLYHYLYKITNLVNNKYYYGIHSTDKLNDNYMGSGKLLHKAYIKYGEENFKKEIILFANNRKELSKLERQIVNEKLVKDQMCYNMVLGGGNFLNKTTGRITVRDKDGNTYNVAVDDPRRLSGELEPIAKGFVATKDSEGNILRVRTNDPRYLSGELVPVSKGKVAAMDKDGNYLWVDVTDPRYISGELKHNIRNNVGRKYLKWVTKDGICLSIHESELQSYLEDGWVSGNIHKGLKCITKDGMNKRVKPEDIQKYLDEGWVRGTNQKYPTTSSSKGGRYVNKDGICKLIRPEELQTYLDEGWELGMKKKNKL